MWFACPAARVEADALGVRDSRNLCFTAVPWSGSLQRRLGWLGRIPQGKDYRVHQVMALSAFSDKDRAKTRYRNASLSAKVEIAQAMRGMGPW